MAESKAEMHGTLTAHLMAHIQNCIGALAGVDERVTADDMLGKERPAVPKMKDLSVLKHLFVKERPRNSPDSDG